MWLANAAVAALAATTVARAEPIPSQNEKRQGQVSNSSLFGITSPPKYPSPWGTGSGNWSSAYEKARAIVAQMTLLEKVNITTGTGWESQRCVGTTGGAPRLGIHPFCMQDSPLGVRFADYVSAFPAGVNVAATWDRSLAYARGVAMGEEHRDKGVDVQLGPVCGPLGRAPEGGRNWEGFAPDPYLTGQLIAPTIQGIQSVNVMACTKHYILNEQEHFRQAGEAQGYGFNITESLSSNIDDAAMHELYLWPFADAVRAGTASIMCSYNQINNSYGCSNSYTLNYLLKEELDFQGFVMSDWGAQHSGVGDALAGMDMAMPGDRAFDSGDAFWGGNLTIAVLNGTVPQWRLDDMAVRIMAGYYYVGRDTINIPVNFDSWTQDTYAPIHYAVESPIGLVNEHVDARGEHAAVIRAIAQASNVLLKNTGALPLTGKERQVGVFGDDAGSNIWGPNGCADRGCDNGTLAMGWGSGTANFPYLVTPETAIQNYVLTQTTGEVMTITQNSAENQIVQLATQADVAIVFVNADSGEGYISVDGNEGDRNNLTLWRQGDRLIQNVTSRNNNTIVVIHSVGAVDVSAWYENDNVTAIIWAGIPGQETGNAIVDALYGRINPGGKLPFTIGTTRASYGTDVLYVPNNGVNAPQQDFTEGVYIDYRHFDAAGITPIYEFGFGLSYTTFSYSNLVVTPVSAAPYTPASGSSGPAPTYGTYSNNSADYLFPSGNFTEVPLFIYPYINSTNLRTAAADRNYGEPASQYIPEGAQDGTSFPIPPAGGAPGGNSGLWDVVATVSATVTNTGSISGDEVAQLYVSLGAGQPPKVLRGFERLTIAAGASATFMASLTRRDVSTWDVVTQNWVQVSNPTIYVGSSSRKLPLSAVLGSSGSSGASTSMGGVVSSGVGTATGTGSAVVTMSDGQPIATMSDGQPIATMSDGQPIATKSATGVVGTKSDGQPTAASSTSYVSQEAEYTYASSMPWSSGWQTSTWAAYAQ